VDSNEIVITEATAHIILGGLTVSYSEGIDGVCGYDVYEQDKLDEARRELIKEINCMYPEVSKNYQDI